MDTRKQLEQALDSLIQITIEDSKHYVTGVVYGSKARFEELKTKSQETI